MPVISVSMTKENGGLSKAQKQKLISGLTSAFVDVVGRGDKTCVVVINEVECQNYGIGGVSIEELRKSQNSLRHYRNSVIASEAKQSLGILNSSLGNSRIYSREFQNSLLCYCIFICIDISKYSSAKTISRLYLGDNFKTRICSRVF